MKNSLMIKGLFRFLLIIIFFLFFTREKFRFFVEGCKRSKKRRVRNYFFSLSFSFPWSNHCDHSGAFFRHGILFLSAGSLQW